MRITELDHEIIERALSGDASAVTAIVRALEGPFLSLARRMMRSAPDAEDATQEALLRVVTHLSQFQGTARFSTWAWRIAVRKILDFRSGAQRLPVLSLDDFGREIDTGLEPEAVERADDAVLLQEVKEACGTAMLGTLDGDHRVAYVLGEILELSSDEAAEILEIDAATFRKRLSRARERVQDVLRMHCGLTDPANRCRCHRRLTRARERGLSADGRRTAPEADLTSLGERISSLAEAQRAAAFFGADPPPLAKRSFVQAVRDAVHAERGRG